MKYLAITEETREFANREAAEAFVSQRNRAQAHVKYQAVKAAELDEGPIDRYEEGYVAGMEMARRLLRLQLGLAVPGDRT